MKVIILTFASLVLSEEPPLCPRSLCEPLEGEPLEDVISSLTADVEAKPPVSAVQGPINQSTKIEEKDKRPGGKKASATLLNRPWKPSEQILLLFVLALLLNTIRVIPYALARCCRGNCWRITRNERKRYARVDQLPRGSVSYNRRLRQTQKAQQMQREIEVLSRRIPQDPLEWE